ncbi:trap dicarboxylate transporter, dctm subunit [Treponema primitia ZAS-2]|uniref:Trap dicarboxylate transporter, dctm subunit n=1 Tax=Treponema primitia (strain ATCC BAA-887 / DSM 12427 / ZAS-2) TaxID=545694 RepID=F5YRC2_TREPZ|nr:TRAP transporter large permease [Treponema primitia]AEF87002.1 trap dicarboxylate transporter, dctm subunit [Treponema primitia ZAS-2]
MITNILLLTLVVFAMLVVMIVIKVPISFALGIATLGGVVLVSNLPLMVIAQRMFVGLDSFTLLAIPLFMLTGQIMAMGGVTRDLMNLSMVFVGWMRGGLAYVNIVASMIFAGITGTASSDTASLGGILIPTMIERKFDKDFTVAVTATSSTIGIMIPPSIPMVLYAIASGTSIGQLFLGGVVPGIIVGFGLMSVSAVISKKRNYPAEKRYPFKESVKICVRSLPALGTVVIIIGGIISGFFTPTEAAGVACFYTTMLGLFYYKELKVKQIPNLIYQGAMTVGLVALMIASASALGWFFTSQGVPRAIANGLMAATQSKVIILLLINAVLLFVGCWMDLAPAVTLFTPILLPVAVAVGVDPVHFGIIMVVNLAIGLFTPPVGVCLFISCGIAKIAITDVLKAFIPFFLVMMIILMLITFVPQISLFLPSLLMRN